MRKNYIDKLIRWGVILMTFLSSINLTGCGENLNTKREEIAKRLLEDKYNEDFDVYTIGKSFGTLTNTTFEVTCSPKSDSDLKFKAEVEKDGDWIDDEYVTRRVSNEVENKISEAISNTISDFAVKVDAGIKSTEITDPGISIDEFMKAEPEESFLIYIIIDKDSTDGITNDMLYDTFVSMLSDLPKLSGRVDIYLADKQVLEKAIDYMKEHANADSGLDEILKDTAAISSMFKDNVLEIGREDFYVN